MMTQRVFSVRAQALTEYKERISLTEIRRTEEYQQLCCNRLRGTNFPKKLTRIRVSMFLWATRPVQEERTLANPKVWPYHAERMKKGTYGRFTLKVLRKIKVEFKSR